MKTVNTLLAVTVVLLIPFTAWTQDDPAEDSSGSLSSGMGSPASDPAIDDMSADGMADGMAPSSPPATRYRQTEERRNEGPRRADPVVRAEPGNLGMFFRLGGLATLTHTNNARNVGPLIFNQVGVKYVLSEALQFPVYFGSGLRVDSFEDSNRDTAANWGFDVGGGFEYHFRIWRRISPFIGGSLGISLLNPTGDDNVVFGLGLGPMAGVEYYIADRLSLTALYTFVIEVAHTDRPGDNAVTSFGMRTLAGGAVNITYYF